MQAKLLTKGDYFKYFSFQEHGTGFGIVQEPKSQENYMNLQTFLSRDFFDFNYPDFLLNPFFNNDIIPDKVHINFELFGIGSLDEMEAFIFKPWVINIPDPMVIGILESFHLFMPSTLFYSLVERLLFLEQLSLAHFPYVRVLQDIPENTFIRFGLDRSDVPSKIKTKRLKILRIKSVEKSVIINFYNKNWEGISSKLEKKYFRPKLNTWFQVSKLGLWEESLIGYVRLYNTNSSFTGGMSIEYIIDKKHRNNGYATEVIDGIVNYLEQFSYVLNLSAEVNDSNYASIRVLQKAGFKEIPSQPLRKDNYSLNLSDNLDNIKIEFEKGNLELAIRNEYLNRYKRYFE